MYKISLGTILSLAHRIALFLHEILLMLICWIYPMIATTVLSFLYVYYETRRQTHTFGWSFYHALCSRIALFSPACIIERWYLSLRKTVAKGKEENCAMVKKYPPSDGSSHPLQNNIMFILWCALQYKYTQLCCCSDRTACSMFRFSLFFPAW